MVRNYRSVPAFALSTSACCRRPLQPGAPAVNLDSSALDVMTDFLAVPPITISSSISIDDANRKMIGNRIRLLVVEDGDLVSGIITASDILGEKPMRIVQERAVKHSEIAVRDVMTRNDQLETIHMRDVLHARVGNVLATLKLARTQHAVVVESQDRDGCDAIRGLFSASQIARQLGVPVHVGDVARTFAEIEMLLNH